MTPEQLAAREARAQSKEVYSPDEKQFEPASRFPRSPHYNFPDRPSRRPTIADIVALYPEVRALLARNGNGTYTYLRHDDLCAQIGGYGYCSCGLDAALAPFAEGDA